MANNFRTAVGEHRASSMQAAMAAMGGGGFDAAGAQAIRDGADRRRAAYEKAAAWSNQGTSALREQAATGLAMANNAASSGLGWVADQRAHEAEVKAAKARNQGGGIGSFLGPALSIAGMFL